MPEEVCQVHRACGQDWQVVEKEEDKLPICSSITAYRQFLCGERSNFALAIGWKKSGCGCFSFMGPSGSIR